MIPLCVDARTMRNSDNYVTTPQFDCLFNLVTAEAMELYIQSCDKFKPCSELYLALLYLAMSAFLSVIMRIGIFSC